MPRYVHEPRGPGAKGKSSTGRLLGPFSAVSASSALAALLLLPLAANEPPVATPAPPSRLGAVGVYSPRIMYLKYQPFVDYLSAATGQHWEFVVSPSYERLIEDVCSGRVTLANLSPYTYVRAHQACGALPVVKLNTGGKPTYRSLIVVRTDSKLRNLSDLAGLRFGFGVPMSTASHLVPRAMLEGAGLHPGTNVECRNFSHYEGAVRAVLLGEVDACGVRDIVAQKYVGSVLRVLARSEEIPNSPLVASPACPPNVRDELLRVLVSVPGRDATAAATIKGWDEELAGGFSLASDEDYAPIRRLALLMFGPTGLTLPGPALRCRAGGP